MARLELVGVFGLIVLMLTSVQATTTAHAALTIPTWANTYHAIGAAETVSSIKPTADGGYIAVGSSNSSGTPGNPHAWVLKLDFLGNVVWQKTYGGVGPDGASSVDQTTDGGYIVAGSFMNSTAGQPSPWVFKLDPTGNIVWQKTFGAGNDAFRSITHTSDGGSAVAGWGTFFFLSCGCQNEGAWVVRLDAAGNVIWQQLYATQWNYGYSIAQTSDGGFVVAGRAHHVPPETVSSWDPLIFKIDSLGNLVWQKIFSVYFDGEVYSARQTLDGGFIVAGGSNTWGDQPSTCIPTLIDCKFHDWVFKLNSTGGMVWQKTYGGTGVSEYANSVDQTSDGGFVIVGPTSSPGGAWIYKLDPAGDILWQKGGPSSAIASVQKTSDGGIVAAGSPSPGYVSFAKLDANGDISPGCNLVGSANFTATSTNATDTGRTLTVGIPFVSVFVSNATATGTSAGTSVQCSGTGTGIGSSSTKTVVFDAATNAAWSGTETTGASAYDTASVTVPGPATATGTVTYTFYTNNACSGPGSPAGKVSLTSTGTVPNSNTQGPLAAGSYSFQDFYSGDSNYSNSTSPCEPFAVLKPDFTISDNPTSLIVRLGSSNTTTITINSINGFSGTITLSATISPQTKMSPSSTLSSTTVMVSPGSPATVLLTITTKGGTQIGNYTVTVSANSGSLTHTLTVPVSVISKKK